MSSTVEPSVHFLAFKDGNPSPDRFRVLWQLVDLQDKPLTSISDGDGSKEIMKVGFHLAEGDLVVFPSLLSGGGKFESMRFVGPKSTLSSTGDDVFPLLSTGLKRYIQQATNIIFCKVREPIFATNHTIHWRSYLNIHATLLQGLIWILIKSIIVPMCINNHGSKRFSSTESLAAS